MFPTYHISLDLAMLSACQFLRLSSNACSKSIGSAGNHASKKLNERTVNLMHHVNFANICSTQIRGLHASNFLLLPRIVPKIRHQRKIPVNNSESEQRSLKESVIENSNELLSTGGILEPGSSESMVKPMH